MGTNKLLLLLLLCREQCGWRLSILMLGCKGLSLSLDISFAKLFVPTEMYQYSLSYFTCLFRSLTFEPEAMPRKNVTR